MQSLQRAADTAINARSEVREAYGSYRSAWDIARHHRDEIVPLRQRIAEENVLRYNGMLIGVFELLADTREQIASVNASIPVASVDVTNDRLMSRLMDPDLLGGKDHPTITFTSTRVEAVDPAHLKVTGDLTIHGVARPVVLDARYLGQATHPFSKKTTAAFRADTAIDRRDFGVTWNAAMDTGGAYLGERVQISLAIMAVRQD